MNYYGWPHLNLLLFRIRSDHNEDNSIDIINEWLKHVEPLYHSVNKQLDSDTQRHQNETSPFEWPQPRFHHLINLKEQAMNDAKQMWADYIFVSVFNALIS